MHAAAGHDRSQARQEVGASHVVQLAPSTTLLHAMWRALPMIVDATVAGVGLAASGYADRISAARPATCGVAIDVPCSENNHI